MTQPTDLEALAILTEIRDTLSADYMDRMFGPDMKRRIDTALRTIAQDAKPVAWMYERSSTLSPDHKETRVGSYIWPDWMQQGWTETPLYTHPSPAPQADAAVVTEGVRRSLKEQIAIDKAAVAALTPIQQELYNRELAAIDGNPGIVFPARPLPTDSAAPSDKDASDGEVERVASNHWSRETIKRHVIEAMVAHSKKEGMAIPAGIAADKILGLLAVALRHHDQENG